MEIAVVVILALVVFGPKKLPELGKSIGNGLKEFKGSLSDTGDAFKGGISEKSDKPASDVKVEEVRTHA